MGRRWRERRKSLCRRREGESGRGSPSKKLIKKRAKFFLKSVNLLERVLTSL